VRISSTKAEYVAISNAVKEVNYVLVKKENNRAIIKSENALTDFFTWHMDTHHHFVQEFIEGGFIEIGLVSSAKNFLQRTLLRSCMKDTRKKFSVEITIPVDCHRIERVLEIIV
jgi:predicted ATP-grasp superfamily ATP-dependent carboligase